MSFSNISATQRQQQEEAFKKVLAIGLLASTLLHGVALPLLLALVKPAEFAEDAIEIVVLDEPKVEETKPEPVIPEKISPPPETFKPEPPPEPTQPEKPPVAATPPPIPEEPPMAATPPPEIEKELPLAETLPPPPPLEPSPPPQQDFNPPETPKTPIANEPKNPSSDPPKIDRPSTTASQEPPQSEPPVTASRPKGAGSSTDVTKDAENPNSSEGPEKNNPLSSSASGGSGEPSSEALNPSSGPIQRSPAAGSPVTATKPGGGGNSGNAIGGVGNLASSGSPVGSASNSSAGGGGNGGGGSSEPFGSGSRPVPKPTNPSKGGSPSRPSGPPPGTCISCGKPEYPSSARQEGRQGRVEVMFDVDPKGKAFNIAILTSSKYDDFDRAAIKTVEKWKFASSDSGIQGKTASITFQLNE